MDQQQTHPKLQPDGHVRWPGARRIEDIRLEEQSWSRRSSGAGWGVPQPRPWWYRYAISVVGIAAGVLIGYVLTALVRG